MIFLIYKISGQIYRALLLTHYDTVNFSLKTENKALTGPSSPAVNKAMKSAPFYEHITLPT